MLQLDTVYAAQPHPGPLLHRSLFVNHNLSVQHTMPMAIQHPSATIWIFALVLLSIVFICLYFKLRGLTVLSVLQSALSHSAMDRILREANSARPSDLAPIALVSFFPIALAIYYFTNQSAALTSQYTGILQFLVIYGIIVGIYFLRNGVIRILGLAFENKEAVDTYLTSNYMYHLLYGVAATTLAFFIHFTGSMGIVFLYTLIGIIALLFVMRLIRGMQLILTNAKTPKLYLFYYLCILEIVPIVILIKSIN